jgi:carbonic anhydrase
MATPEILTGIARFQESYQQEAEFYERLATQGQSPGVLFIACCDSRVTPELITRAKPGDLFTLRTLGNVVPPFGSGQMGVGAAIEFGVLVLRVGHIILCGHTDCGGILALDAPPDWSRASHIARWIEHARPAKTQVEARGVPPEERHLAIVRENVLLQLEHLRSYDPVRDGERDGTLALHGWVYHLETGAIEAYDEGAGSWARLEPAD